MYSQLLHISKQQCWSSYFYVDDIHASMKHMWAPPFTEAQQQLHFERDDAIEHFERGDPIEHFECGDAIENVQ